MAKPSIFSKDYEKKMKQRRRKIVGVIVIVILLGGGLFYQLKLKNMDLNQVINGLQAWVNSDQQEGTVKPEDKNTKPKENGTEENKVDKPVVQEKIVENDFKLTDKETIKVKVEEKGTEKLFNSVVSTGYISDISPDKKSLVVQDKNQNIYLLNVDGKIKNITKEDYVSRAGSKYPKEQMLKKEKASGKDYYWSVDPKFVSNSLIAYKSNLPYFGPSATNQYLWTYNIADGEHHAIWDSKNPHIEILSVDENGKGLKVKIGNNEYILTNEGKLSKE